MAHNPYHIDSTYDVNAQNNQPNNDYVVKELGFDFNQSIDGETSPYSSFFDPYDNQGEQFAGQANALQTAYSNDQEKFLTQGAQQNLNDLSRNTPNTGFAGSGAIERNMSNSREQIMRGYNTGMSGIQFDRANQSLDYQKDIYGMREDYKKDQRNTLLDLIQSDANIEEYATDYIDPDKNNRRQRGVNYGSTGGNKRTTSITRTNPYDNNNDNNEEYPTG